MNRDFLIVLIPAILVAIGYIMVFHFIAVAPAYGRHRVGGDCFFGGISLVGLARRRSRRLGRGRRASAIGLV
jgi:hypothetical protein